VEADHPRGGGRGEAGEGFLIADTDAVVFEEPEDDEEDGEAEAECRGAEDHADTEAGAAGADIAPEGFSAGRSVRGRVAWERLPRVRKWWGPASCWEFRPAGFTTRTGTLPRMNTILTGGLTRGVAGIILAMWISGCAMTREQKLERQADRVEGSLVKERDRVLAMPIDDGGAGRAWITFRGCGRRFPRRTWREGLCRTCLTRASGMWRTTFWRRSTPRSIGTSRWIRGRRHRGRCPRAFAGGVLHLDGATPGVKP
jgi:hypothetical protein